jgi:hypothetical protein
MKKKFTKDEMEKRIKADPQIEHLRRENAELRASLKSKKQGIGEQTEVVSQILAEIEVAEPPDLSYVPPKSASMVASPCSLVIQLSDWHIGQKTEEAEIEGFGKFNYEIAEERVHTLLKKLLDWTEVTRQAYRVDECVILGTGDYISGDIHQELLVTNEFPAPVQAVKAGYLMGEFVRAISGHFAKTRAEIVTLDNHGRLTKKPQKAQGGLNNFGFITASIAKEYCKTCSNVDVRIHPVASAIVEVQKTRYLCGHGDGIIGTFGIPYYGIQRKQGREVTARFHMDESKRHHKMVIGHFHSALNQQDWMIGGSLSGTDANDHKEGRHSLPHQTAWFVHPNHGEFSWTRFWL